MQPLNEEHQMMKSSWLGVLLSNFTFLFFCYERAQVMNFLLLTFYCFSTQKDEKSDKE
jgi:hypothetical protein